MLWHCFNPIFDPKIFRASIVLIGGCGAFPIFPESKENYIVSIDISAAAVRELKKKTKSSLLVVADLENLPFREESFDCVLCTQVFHHVNLKMAVNQAGYVLKKKSLLLNVDINKNNIGGLILRSSFNILSKLFSEKMLPPRDPNEHPLEIVKLYAELQAEGFEEEYLCAFLFFSPLFIIPLVSFFPNLEQSRFAEVLVGALLKIDDRIAKLPLLRSVGYNIVNMARKRS